MGAQYIAMIPFKGRGSMSNPYLKLNIPWKLLLPYQVGFLSRLYSVTVQSGSTLGLISPVPKLEP